MGIMITMSRQLGAEGEEIARDVAETLGLRVVGQEIIHEAMRAGVPEEIAIEPEKGKRGWIERALHWFDRVQTLPASPGILMDSSVTPISAGLVSSEDYYLSVMESIIFDITQRQDVLLLGRAGQMIFRNHPGCFHVRIVAPVEKRVSIVQQRFGVARDIALQKIERSDKARADFLRSHYSVDIDDARLYNLCINTGAVPKETAVRPIADAVTGTSSPVTADQVLGRLEAVQERKPPEHVAQIAEAHRAFERVSVVSSVSSASIGGDDDENHATRQN
jgi:predicted nucleic acid-binding protein